MDNRERARARDKKQRRRISLKEQHENYVVALIKRETLATSKVKMRGSKEKRKLRRKLFVNTYDISSMKRVTTAKKCRRKYVARAKSFSNVAIALYDF